MDKENTNYNSDDSGGNMRSDAQTTEFYTQSYADAAAGGKQSTGEQITDKAGQIADQAKDALGDTVGKVREQAVSQADQQKSRAAETLTTVAGAVRQTGDQLRQQDQETVAQYVDTAASQIERMATYLQNRDINDMAIELQHFARRQPAIFLGGALMAGMLAARFLKSSSRQGQQVGNMQGQPGYGYGSYRGYGSYGGYNARGYSAGNYGENDGYSDYGDGAGGGQLDFASDYPGSTYGSDMGSVGSSRVRTSSYTTGSTDMSGSSNRDGEGAQGGSEGFGDSAYGNTGMSTNANSGQSTEVP